MKELIDAEFADKEYKIMGTKVECTECEFKGNEDDLHYRKAKPWATSEDGFCPNCGGPVEYEKAIEINGVSLLKECERCPHTICHLGKQCSEPLHIKDNERKMTFTFELPEGLTPEEEYQYWLRNNKGR